MCAGYSLPIDELPRPVWCYPFHWTGLHTYGTGDVWHCPCELPMYAMKQTALAASTETRSAPAHCCYPLHCWWSH